MDKENAVQAVVVMDTFNNNFDPITSYKPMGLFTVAGVPLVNYVLESLALGGVDEAILFCCNDGVKIKEHLRKAKEQKAPWSLTLDAQVLMSDTCQTMGDVMREIDAGGLIRGYFVLTSINSIANIPYASMLEQHKTLCKKNKGAAMTLVYKKVSWEHPLIGTDKPIFLAADANTRKVLIHKKYKPKSKDKTISLPLESVLNHSEVKLHHNLLDANIALCSPSVPPLFSDNFDFQTRDDFINGILINEEILASSLYYTLLKDNMYATTVTNWRTFKIISRDILHHWALPLSIESGSLYQDNYEFMGNHNFCNKTATLSRSCSLKENVLIGANTKISDNTDINKSVTGSNNQIGNNVTIIESHIGNNNIIHDNCKIIYSFINNNCIIGFNCYIENGTIGSNNILKDNTVIKNNTLIGNNCVIGNKATITGSHMKNNIVIDDNNKIVNCYIDYNCVTQSNCDLEHGRIGANSKIGDNTVINRSVLGNNCMIGKNVIIIGSHLKNNTVVPDNSKIINNSVDENCTTEKDCDFEKNVKLTFGTKYRGSVVEGGLGPNDNKLAKSTSESGTDWEHESTGSEEDEVFGFEKTWSDSESCYSSDSSAESSILDSPIADDTNIFLQEVIDSLARGYEEKLKCDYLILEINSSRYAYNIQLHEVNFFVVRALLSLPVLADAKNVLVVVKDILKFFRPVLANYIKTKSSIMDCLKAVEESCIKCDWLNGKGGQIIQLLYGADVVDEDSLLEWYKDLQDNESPIAKQPSLVKFFEWLEEAESEESD